MRDCYAAARFEREATVAVAVKTRFDYTVGLSKRSRNIPLAHTHWLTGLVRAPLFIEQRGSWHERLFHVNDRLQRFVLHLDLQCRVLGQRGIIGYDQRNRLTGVANTLIGHGRRVPPDRQWADLAVDLGSRQHQPHTFGCG